MGSDPEVHFTEGTGPVTAASLSAYTAELLALDPSPFGGAKLGVSSIWKNRIKRAEVPQKKSRFMLGSNWLLLTNISLMMVNAC